MDGYEFHTVTVTPEGGPVAVAQRGNGRLGHPAPPVDRRVRRARPSGEPYLPAPSWSVGFGDDGLHGRSFMAQQLTRLHTAMEVTRKQRLGYLIGVTSAVYGEGKTTLVSQLGPLMAQHLHHRVLLVDGNVANPALHTRLGIEARPGYLDLLSNESPDLFPAYRTMGMENLLVLPAGTQPPLSPERFIRSAEMRGLLKDVRSSCEYGVVDLPPVLPVADTALLANSLDAIILVVRAGVTPRELVHEAIERLGPDRVIGCVLNGVEDSVPKCLRWLFMG